MQAGSQENLFSKIFSNAAKSILNFFFLSLLYVILIRIFFFFFATRIFCFVDFASWEFLFFFTIWVGKLNLHKMYDYFWKRLYTFAYVANCWERFRARFCLRRVFQRNWIFATRRSIENADHEWRSELLHDGRGFIETLTVILGKIASPFLIRNSLIQIELRILRINKREGFRYFSSFSYTW